MKTEQLPHLLVLLTVLLLAGCSGGTPAPTLNETDRVATRVAEELAVAATLTTTARQSVTQAAPTVAGLPTVAEVPTPAPTTAVAPLAAPTPILIALVPVDGSDGNENIRNGHPVKNGRNVILPDFTPEETSDPMEFSDRLVFQVEVFDAAVGTYDGDGIQNVTFTIFNENGDTVHERTENTPGYCVFGGGEPACDVWRFEENGNRWPDGDPIESGEHQVQIDILTDAGEQSQWRWRFKIAQDVPPAQLLAYTARITGIRVQNNRYIVDFETTGFNPYLPGQHVHFFFDTVSPAQAGLPGNGPWKVYGGPSPFTEYGPGDRPAQANQMCVLVANPDHSILPETGNCVDLP